MEAKDTTSSLPSAAPTVSKMTWCRNSAPPKNTMLVHIVLGRAFILNIAKHVEKGSDQGNQSLVGCRFCLNDCSSSNGSVGLGGVFANREEQIYGMHC